MAKRLAILLFLLFASCTSSKHPAPSSWNILWIVIDDLNVQHLSAYGYKRATSPFLKRFSKKAVKFENCFSQAPWTLPSFASMLTSRFPYELVMNENYLKHLLKRRPLTELSLGSLPSQVNTQWYSPLGEDVLTFAELVKSRGYKTFALTNNQWLSPKLSGLNQGFDSYVFMEKPDKYYLPAEEVFARAQSWIEENQTKQWFVFLHLMDPHIPYKPHPEFDFGKRLIDRYDAEIAYLDSELKEFFSWLEEKGFLEKTVIVINADHGEAISKDGTRTLGHGGRVDWAVLRVPLFLYFPGAPGGKVIKKPVSNLDIVPTLLELFKIPNEMGCKGKSLLGLIKGRREKPRKIFSMAVLAGVEQISLIYEECQAVYVPAYELWSFSKLKGQGASCAEEKKKELKAELKKFYKQVIKYLLHSQRKAKLKLTPEEISRLKALGYLK